MENEEPEIYVIALRKPDIRKILSRLDAYIAIMEGRLESNKTQKLSLEEIKAGIDSNKEVRETVFRQYVCQKHGVEMDI